MATPRVARAQQLAAQLVGAGVNASADPAALTTPGVLIGPPRLVFDGYAGPTATWRVLAIAGTAVEADAWRQLDALVQELYELLPIELAEPTAYAPNPGSDPLPAYALTITETVES